MSGTHKPQNRYSNRQVGGETPKPKIRSPNQPSNPNMEKVYDLVERTARFGEEMIRFTRKLPEDAITKSLVSPVVCSSTSIGANYMEADGSESRKDFKHRIAICKREASETMHWLRMIAAALPPVRDDCRRYWHEAHELTLIFSSMYRRKRDEEIARTPDPSEERT